MLTKETELPEGQKQLLGLSTTKTEYKVGASGMVESSGEKKDDSVADKILKNLQKKEDAETQPPKEEDKKDDSKLVEEKPKE